MKRVVPSAWTKGLYISQPSIGALAGTHPKLGSRVP